MASYNPPTEDLPIFDNEVFSASSATSSTILTVGLANLLYLRKTFPDTATALETFNAGIKVSDISPLSASTTLSIGASSTGVINIGTTAGRSQIIHIGDGDNNIAGSGVHINNGVNTASNVQILNGTGSTGAINLGSSTSITNCNCPLSLTYIPSAITGTNQLGYRNNGTIGTTTITTGGTVYTFYQATLTAGVWIITGNVYFNGAGNSQLSISATTGLDTNCYNTTNLGAGACLQVTRIVNTSGEGLGPWYLVGSNAISGSTIGSVRFLVYKIA